jgi:hypothetical protein
MIRFHALVACLLIQAFASRGQTPDTWAEVDGLGFGVSATNMMSPRYRAVAFATGGKGYIGTGNDNALKNDFWAYDPVGNTLTQVANFGGMARESAVAFAVGGKGYVGTGGTASTNANDFWCYDPFANTWSAVAPLPAAGRKMAVAFTAGSKGYVGTGEAGGYLSDFYSYDPVLDDWDTIASFPTNRIKAAAFGVNGKGYVGTGAIFSGNMQKDFWSYDPLTNAWTQVADIGGMGRVSAVAFAIDSLGFMGTGDDALSYPTNNFQSYSPTTNTWTSRAAVFGRRQEAVGFAVGGKGYVATGSHPYATFHLYGDVVEFDPSGNSWLLKLSGNTTERNAAFSFSIGDKGYVGGGSKPYSYGMPNVFYSYHQDFWRFDPSTGAWTQLANYGGGARAGAFAFAINGTGYAGCGTSGTGHSDCWAYDPAGNAWTPKASFPGGYRSGLIALAAGDTGYVGTGFDGSYLADFYAYDPVADAWYPRADFGGLPRAWATAFSIGGYGYVGLGGIAGAQYKDFWRYDPATGAWDSIAAYPGTARVGASGFTLGGTGYVVGGAAVNNNFYLTDVWAYDAASDAWQAATAFGGRGRAYGTAFTAGGRGYFGTGNEGLPPNQFFFDFWEYTPCVFATVSAGGPTTICDGDSVVLSTDTAAGFAYQWYLDGMSLGGATGPDYIAGDAGMYTVTVTAACGAATSVPVQVTVEPAPAASIAPAGPVSLCAGESIVLVANTGGGLSHQWMKDGAALAGETDTALAVNSGGDYSVVVANAAGCTALATSVSVGLYQKPTASITPSGPISLCMGESVVLEAFAKPGWSYQWKKDGADIPGAVDSAYEASASGYYRVVVTNAHGCTKQSPGVNINVYSKPSATFTPSNPMSLCAGDSVVLQATVKPGFTFQWKRYGVPIAGATAADYTVTMTGYYRVEVTNAHGCTKLSQGVNIRFYQKPSAVITPQGPTNFCSGHSVVLTANTKPGWTHQWLRDGVDIAGATDDSYTAFLDGYYRVVVTKPQGCSKRSQGVNVNVFSNPSATITPLGPTTFCAGDSVQLSANIASNLTYQWIRNGLYTGDTGTMLTVHDAGDYRVETTNANGCSATSDTVTVNIPCRMAGLQPAQAVWTATLYPVPFNDRLVVRLQASGRATIEVTDTHGRILLRRMADEGEAVMETAAWPAGIYMVRVTAPGGVYVGRAVKSSVTSWVQSH